MFVSRIKALTLYPSLFARHYSHFLAGIIQYSQEHNLSLSLPSVFANSNAIPKQVGASFLHCELHSGETINICFDMADWPDIASIDALDHCDIYIKRSFSEKHLSTLPSRYREKIVPYGFYFACSQKSLGMEFKAVRSYWVDQLTQGFTKGYSASILLGKWACRAAIKGNPSFIPLSSLENISGGDNTVFYHARVWDPKKHSSHTSKSIEELNNTRMQLVLSLRSALGDKFIGGITPSEYASKICPELITPHGSDSNSYLKLLAQSKIVITEEGLHGSTGSRMGEYFAASRCVVSEPLYYQAPFPPVDGSHSHTFNSVTECVDICLKLLKDQALIEHAIENATALYRKYLNPKNTIFHLFEDSVSKITHSKYQRIECLEESR